MEQKILCVTAGQRSGTTALREQLWKTGRFYDFSEIFDPSIITMPHSYFGFCANNGVGVADIISVSDADYICKSFINHLFDLAVGANVLIDVKLNSWNEIRPPWTYIHQEPHFLTYLKKIDAGFIFVRRRDVIQQILSERLADNRRVWHNIQPNEYPSVHLDVGNAVLLMEYFLKSEAGIFDCLRNYTKTMFMDYEDLFLCGNVLRAEYKSALCDYAGETLSFADLGDYKKNDYDLAEEISNYIELKIALQLVVEKHRASTLKKEITLRSREKI